MTNLERAKRTLASHAGVSFNQKETTMLKLSILPISALGLVTLTGVIACGDDGESVVTPAPSASDAGAESTSESGEPTGAASTESDSTSDEVTGDTGSTSSGSDETTSGGDELPTITELVKGSDDFTVLASALEATGLDDALAGEGPFTVFAPTDEAFALLPEGLVAGLSNEQLADVLKYHVVSGNVLAETVVTLDSADTLLEEPVKIQVTADGVYLNGLTKVVTTDVQTANGVVHIIDSVLVPGAFPGSIVDVLGSYPRLSALYGAATPEAAEALSGDNLTLLAPVNSAFDGLDLSEVEDLNPILFYHALAGVVPSTTVVDLKTARSVGGPFMGIDTSDGVKINDGSKLTSVIYTDIAVASGDEGSTIHLVDEVLLPPPAIAEVAQAAGLTTLVEVLGLANVPGTEVTFAEALEGEGPFTVFAPSNEAFAALGDEGFGDALGDVLGAHAISGVVDSNAVVQAITDGGQSPETLTGGAENTLGLSLIGGAVAINAMVQVTATDIPAANGVIHLVDSVILPSDIEFPGNMVQALSAYPLFSSLVEAAVNAEEGDVATALQSDGPFTLFAPVNPAFEGIDTTDDLSSILLYHALGDAYDSAAVTALESATAFETVNGADVIVDGEALTVNESSIIGTDLRTSNGVIHIIDEVLLPPAQ
jgi:transforming growth factor-beta-induced protein